MALHVDTLDLNAARQRMAFIKQAAEELGIKEEIIRRDVGKVLLKLEEVRDEQIKEALQPKEKAVTLTDDERAEALALLRDPRLLERIVEDFARCGVVGEETNKLVGYLGVVSRHLEAPLAVIVQSSSAAGKEFADGCSAGLRAGGAARSILRHDGAITLLHGRDAISSTRCWPSWKRPERSGLRTR